MAATFSITSLALALSTLLGGKLQDKLGIRKLTTFTGISLGLGLILASKANSLIMLYLTAGVVVGASDGIAYMTSLSNSIKWFPEKKGLIAGISVGSYGVGSFVFKYINAYLINTKGAINAFLYWGVIVMILIVVGAQLLKDAPKVEAGVYNNSRELSVSEMLRTKEAYALFIVLFTVCMSGLYIISIVKDLGVQLVGLKPNVASNAVAMVAICNTIGRLMLGTLSDRLGRVKVIILGLIVTTISLVGLDFAHLSEYLFFICVAGVAFSFGGSITVFPTIVGEMFGINNQTKNYGVIYQGFGIGAITASLIGVMMGGFKEVFSIIIVLNLISILLTSKLEVLPYKRKPEYIQN